MKNDSDAPSFLQAALQAVFVLALVASPFITLLLIAMFGLVWVVVFTVALMVFLVTTAVDGNKLDD